MLVMLLNHWNEEQQWSSYLNMINKIARSTHLCGSGILILILQNCTVFKREVYSKRSLIQRIHYYIVNSPNRLYRFRRAWAVGSQLSRRRVGERLGKKPAALGWFGNCAKHIDDLTIFSKIVFKESALKDAS